jgi:DNA replication and repair protein RecF
LLFRSLRLALAQLLRAESPAGDPVINLDDVFAELDSGRRQHLMDAVGQFEQVIVTAAVEEDIPAGLSAHRIHVSEGAVVDAGTPMINGGARDVGAR